jgi:hypothetical protein
MKIWLELTALLLFASIIVLVDIVREEPAYGLNQSSSVRLTKEEFSVAILANARRKLPPCFDQLSGRYSALTKAIAAVEFGSRSSIEQAIEEVALRLSILTGTEPIDLSYGAMQLRPSTIRKWVNPNIDARLMSRQLIDECGNMAMGQELLAKMARSIEAHKEKSFDETVWLIRTFNGQKTITVNNFVYLQLASSIYKDLLL